MKIAVVQFAPEFGKTDNNLERALSLMKAQDAELFVLPELPFSGYLFQDRDECVSLAEDPMVSATVRQLTRFCARKRCAVVTGFCERSMAHVYNSALFIGPDGVEATYRKLHLFNTEKSTFDPGNLPLPVVDYAGIRVGMMVCFDWALPEPVRTLALAGAQIVCQPSNLVLDKCQRAMFARSVENGVFTATANRCGSDERPSGAVRFTGRSQILSPTGECLAQAGADTDEVIVAEIDPSQSDIKMITPSNHLLHDRRPKWYRNF